MAEPTYRSEPFENEAEFCRRHGLTPGTRLVGDEGYGPTVIEITALGERKVLAKTISHNGRSPIDPVEGSWTLSCRDWALATSVTS
jgi:hypothetical protein